jgi:hypothetical protein
VLAARVDALAAAAAAAPAGRAAAPPVRAVARSLLGALRGAGDLLSRELARADGGEAGVECVCRAGKVFQVIACIVSYLGHRRCALAFAVWPILRHRESCALTKYSYAVYSKPVAAPAAALGSLAGEEEGPALADALAGARAALGSLTAKARAVPSSPATPHGGLLLLCATAAAS